jgi:hypothetical protein
MREANPLTRTVVTGGATVTTRVDEMFDGVGMMKDFLQWVNRDIYDDESDFHLECLVQMRAHPLPADCTESQPTSWVAQVTANLNPYLGTYALKGLELSRFIINSLPKSLSQTHLALLRRLKTDPASCANYLDILSECCEAIRLTRDKSIPVLVLGVFGANGIAYTPPKKDKAKPPVMGTAGDAGDVRDSAKGK